MKGTFGPFVEISESKRGRIEWRCLLCAARTDTLAFGADEPYDSPGMASSAGATHVRSKHRELFNLPKVSQKRSDAAAIKRASQALQTIAPEQRLEVMRQFCRVCGALECKQHEENR